MRKQRLREDASHAHSKKVAEPVSPWPGRWKEAPAPCLLRLWGHTDPPFKVSSTCGPSQPRPFPRQAASTSGFLMVSLPPNPRGYPPSPTSNPTGGSEPPKTHTSEGSSPNLNVMASRSRSGVILLVPEFEAPQSSRNPTCGLVPYVGSPLGAPTRSPKSLQPLPGPSTRGRASSG